ncbi:MAG: HD-GYP domain-containing protein [Humidesulfovibrio sp.]|uniref:HD-GYP domain-containing protein n=1 Tax=Humidesulfovibrio sp. TaxID=2910988 RepID=UPI0027F3956F|nr:HD-GYP domain-containing protein [Humidesulfovibrio sp.]MDQ7836824.1 HD-GYP domain-containing protein [Humidesulfovibrio sp.]
MNSRLNAYAPLLLSLVLGGLTVLLVLRIVSFSDAVTSYYTPAILNFENLMEGSQHLKVIADGERQHQEVDNIAAQHFLLALDKLTVQVEAAWPRQRKQALQGILTDAGQVRESLERGDFAAVGVGLNRLIPILVMHTQEHRDELVNAKRSIRDLTLGVGALSLVLIALGYVATMRERRVAELQAWEQQTTAALTSLITALEAREPYTKGHSVRVARHSQEIAERMGLDDKTRHRLHMAALLHDIGKIGVPDSVLLKEDRLTDSEYAVMKRHPEIGAHMLSNVESLADVLPVIRHHHERHDGKGYPDGLAGEAIPVLSRIISVADTYDAMTTTRPYRKALTKEEACAELQQLRDQQWDGGVVDAFLSSRS